MKRDWKPGDVALASYDGEVRVYMYQADFLEKQSRWVSSVGTTSVDFSAADWWRRLVVIDPEDREQVHRLADLFCEARWCHVKDGNTDDCDPLTRSSMRDALAAYANPTPPKPKEPTGLGAVVEDADGNVWTRTGKAPSGDWVTPDGGLDAWLDVPAVRVLSEGVTL